MEPANIFAIVGHEAERVRDAVAGTGVQFLEQTEQRGTGHAIQCAREAIAGYENVLVLSGDVPLIRPETIGQVWGFHQAEGAAMTILTAAPENPSGYGRIVRRSPHEADVEAIVEQKALKPKQESIREINSGIYAFRTAPLLAHLDQLTTDNPHGELYLTDIELPTGEVAQSGDVVSVDITKTDAYDLIGRVVEIQSRKPVHQLPPREPQIAPEKLTRISTGAALRVIG